MTTQQAYQYGVRELENAGVEEAKLDAWYLLEYVTKVSRAEYFANPQKNLEQEQELQYFLYIEKRAQRIPLQHITGEQAFMGLSFLVNEAVLIPRQDTEILVEHALDLLQARQICGDGKTETAEETSEGGESETTGETSGGGETETAKGKDGNAQNIRILDMCTGSGCILLSILHYMKEESPQLVIEGTGADISCEALQVAQENGERLGIQATWQSGDLFSRIEGQYQMIVANPPYIRTSSLKELQEEVRYHDPRIALDGHEDGLYFYRRIVTECKEHLEEGGHLLMEIGYDQAEEVCALMRAAGFSQVEVKKDLAGLDRVVIGVYDRCA